MKRLFFVVAFVSLAVLAQRATFAQHDVVVHTLNTHAVVASVVPVAHVLDSQTDPATITVYVAFVLSQFLFGFCTWKVVTFFMRQRK